ncbi:MAG: ATP-binding protein, partial [Bacteroidota bacterium]
MDPRIRSFQTLAFVGGLIIAVFALVNRAPGVDALDPLGLRIAMTTLCWGGGIALSVVPWVRDRFEIVAHTVIGTVTSWQLYLVWINDLAVAKVLGLVIVVVVCILGFRDVRALGVYAVAVVLLGAATALTSPAPAVPPVYMIATLATITTMGVVMLRARLRLERELRGAREKAEASDAAKSVYVATMSHEIRTPVNAMVGMADVLLETDLDGEQQEVADSIYRAGQALSSLIDNVLDFSKIEAGQVELERRPIALRSTLDSLVGLVAQQARANRVDLIVHVDPSVPDTITGDPTRFQQVLMNLLANAVKFTKQGYVALRATARAREDGSYLLGIAVQDTGVGIPEDRQASIFMPYQQAAASTTRQYGGTGLGLTIVRQLVELMGGTIALDSVRGHGS